MRTRDEAIEAAGLAVAVARLNAAQRAAPQDAAAAPTTARRPNARPQPTTQPAVAA